MQNKTISFYEWTQELDDYDIFVHCPQSCFSQMQAHFPEQSIESAYLSLDDGYYYLIDIKKNIISPLPDITLAFGGQYNGYPPIGKILPDFIPEYDKLTLLPYHSDFLSFPYAKKHN